MMLVEHDWIMQYYLLDMEQIMLLEKIFGLSRTAGEEIGEKADISDWQELLEKEGENVELRWERHIQLSK